MENARQQSAAAEFRRMIKWIVVAGVLMVIGALLYIRAMDAWSLHAVIATILGVFVSVLLGSGFRSSWRPAKSCSVCPLMVIH